MPNVSSLFLHATKELLRRRFVVGYNPIDGDYDEFGAVGGEKTHTLSVEEMPEHDHGLKSCFTSFSMISCEPRRRD